MRLFFHPAAEREMIDAARYYESKVEKLGSDFLDEIAQLAIVLEQNPQLGTHYLHGTRRIITQRFPYSIIYRITQTRIEVIAIAHQYRKPGYWKEKR